MTSRRLILHVGTHKTGTTSIQASLTRHRDRLAADGVHYANSRPYLGGSHSAHHAFAQALTGLDGESEAAARRFVAALRDGDADDAHTIVVSAESIWRHVRGLDRWTHADGWDDYWRRRRAYVDTLAEVLAGFEVTVVAFVRRPDRFIESYYHESVSKSLTQTSFPQWRERHAVLCDYSTQLDVLRAGLPRVEVLRYEDATDGADVAFYRYLGLEPPPQTTFERRSADARVLLWFQTARPGVWKQRRAFQASAEATALFDDSGAATLWESVAARRAFCDRFGGPFGRSFFEPPTHQGPVATLDDDLAARIADAWERWLAHEGS